MMRGLLIVIEGVNGCGKSTIIKELESYFSNQLVRVYKFPDRSGFCGKQIDDHLHNKNTFAYTYDLLAAFAANRLATKKSILADIDAGYLVICDRYYFSGIAYHVPLYASISTVRAYYKVIGYFDKDMPRPDIVYLIHGEHLSKRSEMAQRYHYQPEWNVRLFHILRETIRLGGYPYQLIKNKQDRVSIAVIYIINHINTHRNWIICSPPLLPLAE